MLRDTCLVIGGGGFLGRQLVQYILDMGKYSVRVLDLSLLDIPGVEAIQGDIRKIEDVILACKGVKIVFHTATATPSTENALNKELMNAVNVVGTGCVVEACRQQGVKKLVYTSSASVVFEGRPLYNVDERAPYAVRPLDYYTRTKIDGEKLVLAANGHQGLATCALRPSGIFGPGDTLMVPSTVRNAKAGKLKYIIGDGKNLFDFTYVANVAQAHVMAADKLNSRSKLAGRAYFITNQEPVPFWSFLGDICIGLGYKAPQRHIPALLILIVAYVFEYIVCPLLRPFKTLKTELSVSRVYILTRERTFSNTDAQKDFGYVPNISLEQGKKLTIKAFSHLAEANGPLLDSQRAKSS